MIKYEVKKLFFKQWGLVALFIVFIAEIFTLLSAYPKIGFEDSTTSIYYNEYADLFNGSLNSEKEQLILQEQERIINAQNIEYSIEEKLRKNKYNSRDEYISEYRSIREITERSSAFDRYFEKYNYVKEQPDKRCIISSNFDGLCRDFPDVAFLIFIIFVTSNLFLTEENSNMVTLIKSYGAGRKTFCDKIFSLCIVIFSTTFIICGIEFLVMAFRCDLAELKYPIQSLTYFNNCPFDISIFQGFIIVSILRLFGALFISSLVVLLSVITHKALPVLFIPSSICLVQQFIFKTATASYYLPTGLIRASGYLRGDAYETINQGSMNEETSKVFSEIPVLCLILIIVFVISFAVATFLTALKYYSGRKKDA